MSSSILATAQAGLKVAQAGLLVTSQNVAGASVEGFSRRDANAVINRLAPNSGLLSGTSFAVDGFVRDHSFLLESQRMLQQGKSSYSEALVQATEILDVIIADESNSLAIATSQFFDAAGRLVGSPKSVAYLSDFTQKSELVAQRVVGLAQTITQVENDSRTALKNALDEASVVSSKLAQINIKIAAGFSSGNFSPSADYLDERDRLLMHLQKLVGGQSMISADGTASHYLEGIPLVEGAFSNKFITDNLEGSVDQLQVEYTTYVPREPDSTSALVTNKSKQTVATNFIQGGEAGAYLKVVRDFLPDIGRRLNSVAMGLLKAVNTISPNAVFGFKTSNGEKVSNVASGGDTYVKEIPSISNSDSIYTIRNRLDPEHSTYTATLTNLNAKNFISMAPEDVRDWKLESDDAFSIEALRSTFNDPIADVVAKVANSISSWVGENSANQSILGFLNDRRESIAGVNLDEEAANMVKFQQIYAASSRLIQTGNQMFETLIAMVSR